MREAQLNELREALARRLATDAPPAAEQTPESAEPESAGPESAGPENHEPTATGEAAGATASDTADHAVSATDADAVATGSDTADHTVSTTEADAAATGSDTADHTVSTTEADAADDADHTVSTTESETADAQHTAGATESDTAGAQQAQTALMQGGPATTGVRVVDDETLHGWIASRDPGEVLDLRGYDLTANTFTGMTIQDVWFGHAPEPDGVSVEPAVLVGTSFRDATLIDVSFVDTDLADVDFRGTTLRRCDFRRAEWRRAIGLEWDTFARPRKAPALIQETSDDEYRAFLRAPVQRFPGPLRRDPVYDRRIVASDTYRRLSALWRDSGRYDWEGKAYVRAKNLERGHYAASRSRFERGMRAPGDPHSLILIGRWLALQAARVTCNYGESVWRVLAWAVALILLPATAYALTGAVRASSGTGFLATHSFGKATLFSLTRFSPSGSDTVRAGNQLVSFFGAGQAVLGIALLALAAFVLAHKLRRS